MDPPILRAIGPATVAGDSADRKLVMEFSTLGLARRFTGAEELKKRRVETCIRRYEQNESF